MIPFLWPIDFLVSMIIPRVGGRNEKVGPEVVLTPGKQQFLQAACEFTVFSHSVYIFSIRTGISTIKKKNSSKGLSIQLSNHKFKRKCNFLINYEKNFKQILKSWKQNN